MLILVDSHVALPCSPRDCRFGTKGDDKQISFDSWWVQRENDEQTRETDREVLLPPTTFFNSMGSNLVLFFLQSVL